jgi:hypothetical protein
MAIRAYVGNLGMGKTFNMVADACKRFRAERMQIYSNMTSLRMPEAVYIAGIEGLPLCENGLILLDEASTEMSSRFFHDTGRLILAMLRQSRKNGLDLWYTAQSFDDVDKSLRDLTNEVVLCRRFGSTMLRTKLAPGTKDLLGRSIVKLDADVFPVYDTFEVIGRAGRGGAIGAAAERRKAGRKALATSGPRAASWQRVKMYERVWWTSTLRLTPDAVQSRDYLETRGGLCSGVGWGEQVRAEMLRRSWLRFFGLRAENVLDDCTFAEPWLHGFRPADVQLRIAEADAQAALETANMANKRARAAKSALKIG